MKGSKKLQLSTVFNDSKIIVPEYQRTYSWDKKQVEEMFNDLIYAFENYQSSEKYHYFGSLVFEDIGTKTVSVSNWDLYNVIDGQQRLTTVSIFARVFINFLDSAINSDNENVSNDALDAKNTLRETYIEKTKESKFSPEDLSSEYYQKLIIEGKKSSYVVNEDSPLVAHRLRDAIECVTDRLKEYIEQKTDNTEERYKLLEQLISVLSNRFRVTVNILDSVDEASRMFKIINERGKDLTRLDIIKSHLMYASTQVSCLEPEQISSKINNAVREISSYPKSTDKDIDNFLKVHWLLFTGELRASWSSNYDNYERDYKKDMSFEDRLKEMIWYANTEREEKKLEKFIKNYINSIEALAPKFSKYQFSKSLIRKDKFERDKSNIFYTLQLSNDLSIKCFVTSLLYSLDHNEQEKLLRLIQKPNLMYNQVMKNSGSYKRLWIKSAHKIFWYKWSKSNTNRNELFEGREHAMWDLHTNKKDLLDEIDSKVKTKNKEKNITDEFKIQLKQPDIIDGNYTNGWGGVRKINTIKTILYYYEKSLRSGDKTGLKNMPTLQNWCKNMELEHMIPKNPKKGQKMSHHDQQVNRLGNLIVLASSENKTASNKPYTEKKKDIYDTTHLRLTDELPDKINSTKLKERSENIIDSLIEEFY